MNTFKSFKITGLFSDRDVQIPFDQNIKILIGENGLGKTTVLNILYYTLTNKFYKLKAFEFKSIELVFGDGQKVVIKKEKLFDLDENLDIEVPFSLIEKISSSLTNRDLNELRAHFGRPDYRHYILDKLVSKSDVLHRYPMRVLLAATKIACGFESKDNETKKSIKVLQKNLENTEVLYFPTFRRIEEDLINLGYDEEKLKINQSDSRLIQFGMKDVKERLEEIKKEINTLSSKGLSQISSEILSQLVKGVPNVSNSTLRNISKKDIDIILARVGEAISKEDKIKITEIVSEKRLKDLDDKYLVYFLQKLINIYDQQREIDHSIESFVSVCNRYLKMSDKAIFYEASEVDFYLINLNRGTKVLLTNLLSKLSSGEKQIISLFSRIYLSKSKDFIVLFDEPELSLSIFWQKLLLPDIVASNKCSFLLSVTHSPFIFENELDDNAIGLNQYIKWL